MSLFHLLLKSIHRTDPKTKIGDPANKVYAIGSVSLAGSYIVLHLHVSEKYIDVQIICIREKLQEMYKKMSLVFFFRAEALLNLSDGLF